MTSEFLVLFLSTCLLVQTSLGKALSFTEGSTTLQPDLSDVTEPPTMMMLFYALLEFSELANTTLDSGKNLFQDVIADISATDAKNEQITERFEEYLKLVKKIEKLQAKDTSDELRDKFYFMVELHNLLDKSNVTFIKKPTSTDKLFDESLKKHGLSSLEQQFEEKFGTFAKGFNEKMERILSSPTIEEMEKTQLQGWLQNFYEEKNLKKKFVLFGKFFWWRHLDEFEIEN